MTVAPNGGLGEGSAIAEFNAPSTVEIVVLGAPGEDSGLKVRSKTGRTSLQELRFRALSLLVN